MSVLARASTWLQARWYSQAPAPLVLRPLAQLYGALADARRRALVATQERLPLPVIVVGNISLGGTGKTPLVLWLIEQLKRMGFRPGVISRGYGGRAPAYPFDVNAQPDPALAGDEPVLIALRSGVPVMVDPDRMAAARALIATGAVDVLVADDGLQHYRLPREVEICVVDGTRGLGNGWRLPAGPLREAPSRLDEVHLVVVNGGGFAAPRTPTVTMNLQATHTEPLAGGQGRPLTAWRGRRVHAVAGIGNPRRYFQMLRAAGIEVIEHAFADHHAYHAADFAFGDGLPVLMTEKDAVKCHRLALAAECHVVPVQAQLEPEAVARVQQLLKPLRA